jgi:hypothetical protein
MIAAATLVLYPMQDQASLASLSDSKQNFQSRRKTTATKNRRINYSGFSHSTHVTQQKLTCDSCHKFPTANWKEVRKGDGAFPDVAEFPEHQSCLNCHRPQFFARERPAPAICSNCHVKATPRDTARFLFDSLGDISDSPKPRRELASEFTINFPHDKHVDVVEANLVPARERGHRFLAVSWQQKAEPAKSSETKSCPVCHQTYLPQGESDEEYLTKPPETLGDNFWLKKGTFKTIPTSHTVCFTCHNAEAEIPPLPPDCNACHKLAVTQSPGKADFDPKLAETMAVKNSVISILWSGRTSSGSFRHEGGEHPNISCLKCHNVPTMNLSERKSLIVSVGSCGGAEGCHVTATTDDGGILNYEIDQRKAKAGFVCTKCHITFGREALPETHIKALLALKKS